MQTKEVPCHTEILEATSHLERPVHFWIIAMSSHWCLHFGPNCDGHKALPVGLRSLKDFGYPSWPHQRRLGSAEKATLSHELHSHKLRSVSGKWRMVKVKGSWCQFLKARVSRTAASQRGWHHDGGLQRILAYQSNILIIFEQIFAMEASRLEWILQGSPDLGGTKSSELWIPGVFCCSAGLLDLSMPPTHSACFTCNTFGGTEAVAFPQSWFFTFRASMDRPRSEHP